jgi:cytochrome P450
VRHEKGGEVEYTDIVKPTTFANDEYFQKLTALMRANDPLPYIDADTHRPFYVVIKHADIIEIERQSDKFLNTARSVQQTKEIKAQIEAGGVGLRTLIHMDNPDHKLFRDLTKDWFMPANLKTLEERVKGLAKNTIDKMLEKGDE